LLDLSQTLGDETRRQQACQQLSQQFRS